MTVLLKNLREEHPSSKPKRLAESKSIENFRQKNLFRDFTVLGKLSYTNNSVYFSCFLYVNIEVISNIHQPNLVLLEIKLYGQLLTYIFSSAHYLATVLAITPIFG